MNLALFSDIHGNLPALEAVLADLDRRAPDARFCLGDLVGYAPWPNEVVERVRGQGIPTLAGNYDAGVGVGSGDCGCAYKTADDEARGAESIAYTNRAVTDDTRRYLRGLADRIRIDLPGPRSRETPFAAPTEGSSASVLLVHGSPRRINQYLFEDHPESSLLRMMDEAGADVLACGHTHKPWHRVLAYEADGERRYRHAVNIGSVGKPKDGDPRACYALLCIDERPVWSAPDALAVEFVRVAYDVERTARAIEEGPLPGAFADMLRKAY